MQDRSPTDIHPGSSEEHVGEMRIPFETPDIHHGFSEGKGFVYLDDEFLVFEVRIHTLGLFEQEAQVIKVEPAVIEAIRLERGLFSDKLCIRPRKIEVLDAIPGDHEIEVKLKVKRKHRLSAQQFVADVSNRILSGL